MALVLRPAPPDAPEPPRRPRLTLPERLSRLGAARRSARLRASVGWSAVAVALPMLALLVADALFRLPLPARAVGLSALLAVGLLRLARSIRPAYLAPSDAASVAALVEIRDRRFNDLLASAVEFAADPRRGDSAFRATAVRQAESQLRRADLAGLVPSASALWGTVAAGLLLIAGAMLALVAGERHSPRAAFLRLLDPYGGHRYPTRTKLDWLTPATPSSQLARGEAFPLRVRLRGEHPELATVEIESGAEQFEETIPVPAAEDAAPLAGSGDVVLEARLDPSRVSRDFRARVVAGDGETAWHTVKVSPAPKLVPRGGRPSPQLHLTPPEYTGLVVGDAPDGAATVEGVAGTVVRFRATADRRLSAARLVFQADRTAALQAAPASALAGTNPLGALAAMMLAHAHTADIPVEVGPDGVELDCAFVPLWPGVATLEMTDETGLVGTRLFEFRFAPDAPPTVTLEHPLPGRDPLTLLTTASFPVQARADDRPFAVTSLELEYRVAAGSGSTWERLPLLSWGDLAGRAGALGGGLAACAAPPPALEVSRVVPVSRLRRPDGSPVREGDLVTLRVAARDTDTRTALKAPGRSREVELRVVGRSTLEAEIQRELAAVRPEAVRLEAELRALEDQTRSLKTPPDQPLSPEQLGRLAGLEQSQRAARLKVADPAEGIRAKVQALQKTAAANSLPRSAATDKLDAAARELAGQAGEALDAAEPALAAARQAAEAGANPQAQASLADAARRQQSARQSVARLLESLEQWGGAGEVSGGARNLQEQIRRAAEGPQRDAGAEKLAQLAEQGADLLAKATRLAAQKDAQAQAARDSGAGADKVAAAEAEAAALRKGVEAAGGDALADDLRQASDATRAERPGKAQQARQSALDRLEALANPLSEPAPPAPSANAGGETKLDPITDEQVELRKKAKAALARPTPEARAEALAELAPQQEKLKREAEAAAEKLTRTDPAAADALRKSAEALDAAREKLEAGQSPLVDQERGLDQLDEAKRELDKAKDGEAERLGEEERDQLEGKVGALADRQKALVAEAERLQAAILAATEWDRGLLASLRDLTEAQSELAKALRPQVGEAFGRYAVFAKLAEQSAGTMDDAAEQLARRGEAVNPATAIDPAGEKLEHAKVNAPMRRALKRLEQMREGFAKPQKPPEPTPMGEGNQAGGPMPPAPMGPMGGTPQAPKAGGVPPLAQLKALRALQAEVAEETRAFADAHPAGQKLRPAEAAELKRLEKSQGDVAVLFEKLAQDFAKSAGRPEELP